jgi:hypothetical protein
MQRSRCSLVVGWCAGVLAIVVAAARADAQTHTLWGLINGANTLVRFNSATPGTIDQTLPITGVLTGETLRGIDFRPATGQLFAIATNAAGDRIRVYTINLTTGAATSFGPLIGESAPITPGQQWGMGFNPVPDRIRVVNEAGENLRLNPNDGTLSADDTNLNSPSSPPPVVDSSAYDRQFGGATQTTLFAINRATNSLAYQGGLNGAGPGGPNGGAITPVAGTLGITLNAGSPTALEVATNNVMFAAMRPTGGSAGLYTINTTSGVATLVGVIGTGAQDINSLAVVDPSFMISPGTGTFSSRQRFDLVLLFNLLGRTISSGTVTFNGANVGAALASCIVPGTGAAGLQTLRCANLGGPVLGPGTHVFDINLVLSDGSQLRRSVTWTVLPVTEP